MSKGKPGDYSGSNIKVLEGVEAVRKRPGMYVGSTGPDGLHHLVYEVVDNCIDEAMAGHAENVTVIINHDGSLSVEDDGRGIPTDWHEGQQMSAVEVVMEPLLARGADVRDSRERAETLLARPNLPDRLWQLPPGTFSGGEQQRVAIARALMNEPEIVLADEPTGNLDSNTEAGIIDLLKKLHKERNLTLLVATHDDIVAAEAQRVERLVDGRITD